MVVLWWAVTAGYYGAGFASWQYLLTGVVAFVMLVRRHVEARVPVAG
jgi:hypothetical protein